MGDVIGDKGGGPAPERALGPSPRRASTLYATEYLTVTGASAEHLLAMKLEAGRAADEADIAALVKLLDLRSVAEGVEIHRRLFPESSKDTQSLMADALGVHAKP